MSPSSLTLSLLPDTFAVCRLPAGAALPAWATAGDFYTITRTAHELSIVCAQERVPAGVICQPGWRCLQVAGPLDFALTGVLASLVQPLAAAGISIFAISTFDTDYLLIQDGALDAAQAALRASGHTLA
ncbi:MAG TPA: ACT domain-containing protein [Anaerolineae bacterium]|nr:ACT domain-containing protein [Anaerolineae bacterium]